jgi:hypothetical protein
MNYCSRVRHESKLVEADGTTLKYPGVVYTIQKMNERRRVKRELVIAGLRQQVNEDSAACQQAIKEKDELPVGELDKRYNAFNDLLHEKWYSAWIRWGLYSIEGLDIDDQKATVDTLCEAGPSDLVQEIFLAIIEAAGISTAQTKNSSSASTSDGQVDGKTSNMTAATADQPDGGKTEIAQSSTPAT